MLAWARIVGALALLVCPALAQAQAGGVEQAREHMERGQALYLQGRFEEAAVEFEAAYDAHPFSAFLYNAGVALERAGQAARAAELFQRYIDRDPQASDAQGVRERLARLREQAQQQAAAPPATEPAPAPTPQAELPEDFKSLLSVRTNPAGARIVVTQEGREVAQGPSPFAQTLDQGSYLVRVEHPDYQTVQQEMRIEPGRVYVVIVEMSQGQFLGYLRVAGNVPGAQVFIDDREQGPRGQTPFEAPAPVGTHRIWVERAGYEPFETEVEVGVGADVSVQAELERVDHGRLRVVANVEGARVYVDGQEVGRVPYEGQHSPGPHRLQVIGDGMKGYEVSVRIERGQLTPVRVRLRPDVGRGGAWATATIGLLSLGAGITMAILSNEWANQIAVARDAGTLASDDHRLDEGFFLSVGADIAFGVTLILGGLALYQFLNDPLPPSEGNVLEARDWALLPWLDPRGGAGLGLGGTF